MKQLRSLFAVALSISLVALSPGWGTCPAMASVMAAAASASRSVGTAGIGGSAVGAHVRAVPLTIGAGLSAIYPRNVDPGLPPVSVASPKMSANASADAVKTLTIESAIVPRGISPVMAPHAGGTPGAPEARALLSIRKAQSARAPSAKGRSVRSALEGLRMPLPTFGRMFGASAKSAAHNDFVRRMGAGGIRGSDMAVAPDAGAFRSGSRGFGGLSMALSAKKADEDMPDHGRSDERTDLDVDHSDLDELGNTRRRQSPGPDDTGSGSGGGDEFGGDGGRSNSERFGFTPLMLAGSSLFLAPVLTRLTFLPAVRALGSIWGGGGQGAAQTSASEEIPDATELIVRFPERNSFIEDAHLGWVDVNAAGGMQAYKTTVQGMRAQLHGAGMDMTLLAGYQATPIAVYKRINAATLRLPASQANALRAELESRGIKVYDNERREIIRPIEDDPHIQQPKAKPAGGNVSMEETLKISTMDQVHESVRKQWGSPQQQGWRGRLLAFLLKALGGQMAQPNIGVIDTGVEKEHRLIRPGLKAAKDVNPNGDGADENGHGTWVTSMVLWFAPWLKNITHYKIFGNGGGATLDDVLKGLTMAGNDGNIVISNSWGSNDGNPDSPDSVLVKKLAEEGHVMVFAAGNNGYSGKNTIGSPAISHYVDPKTGVPRVISVAATDRNKVVTRFSSKGPGSRQTQKLPDYPRKPDAAEQGDNTEGAWIGGKTRAISGTSMSTPKFAGTIAMLAQVFGVTQVGEDLDRIVRAVMETLENPQNEPETSIGDGFSAAYAAYQQLRTSGLVPVKAHWLRRAAIWLLDRPAPSK